MSPIPRTPLVAFVVLGSLLVQGFHVFEHLVGVVGRYVFESSWRGLLGENLDREWVHLVYNAALLGALVFVFSGRRTFLGSERGRWTVRGILAFQAYHVIEHIARVQQYMVSGIPDTPGLLGHVFEPELLHLVFNLVTLGLMVFAFQRVGLLSSMVQIVRGPRGTANPG